ncbi:MAG: cell wall-binding repeat-containing protein [Desulfitobacteriaceae bacterium]
MWRRSKWLTPICSSNTAMSTKKPMSKLILLTFLILSMTIFFLPQKVYASTTLPRLSGSDRYGTAIAISQAGWDKSDNVVLATGGDFPDALSAAPLAKQLNAPILLTTKDSLSKAMETELQRLQAKNIYLIGGYGAISETLENELKGLQYHVFRIDGNDRYETSIKIASYIVSHFNVGSEIAIATGNDFPDALSMAPVAASDGIPIILSPANAVSDDLKAYLIEHKVSKVYVIGGTGVINEHVLQQLPNPERLWGADRYTTNIAILNKFSNSVNFDTAYVATGTDFPDALAGAALAAKSESPIILSSQYGAGISESTSYNQKVNKIQALGGEGALTPSVLQNIISAIDDGANYEFGNSPWNIANQGYAAGQGDYVYYYQSIGSNTGAIYKMKKDGTGKIKLCDTGIDSSPDPSINVVGDWVYYRYSTTMTYLERPEDFNGTRTITAYSGKIYKIKTDGTENTKLSDDNARDITVIGDWIYYYTSKFAPVDQIDEPGIYKMRTDGTGKVKLTNLGDTGFIKDITDSYIFYYDTGSAYRINRDGSGKTQIINGSFMVYGTKDWIYYIVGDFTTSNQLYKTRLDGSEKTVLYDGAPIGTWLNVSNDYIYFAGMPPNIGTYRIKTDGTGLTKISDDLARSICIVDDYIYCYFNDSNLDDGPTYRIKVNGTDKSNL